MSDEKRGDGRPLPIGVLDRIDRICDRFEASRTEVEPLTIEDLLGEVGAAHRHALLRDLVASELDARGRRGERPEPREYYERFPSPGDAVAIDAAFAPESWRSPAPGSAARSVANGRVPATSIGSLGALPRVVLQETRPDGDEPVLKKGSAEIPRAGESGRYQVLGEIARGGMGAVLKARDPDLGRDLAVKVLLEEHHGKPELVRRFVEEAQIAGQLQHPGIVPVYELGAFGDRRPYFTMKLVNGRTLSVLLQERKSPADDLPRFLGIFEHIVQTMAYAHARGVIHRDLKPSNVMVGSFGEVQIMDWGLAKVLKFGAIDDEAWESPAIRTVRSGSEKHASRAGSVLGTPAYMAPEQAGGDLDEVDCRADVFGLGSILCEILTGRPAYSGRTSDELLVKAARGATDDAFDRLDACATDAALIALAKDCLAFVREDRPCDAGAVAARIRDFQSGVQEKLRRADLLEVEERSRMWMTTVTAAAVIVLSLAGAGGYAWHQRQTAHRLSKTTGAVDAALAEADRLRGEAQSAALGEMSAWNDAVSAAKRAAGLVAQGESDSLLRSRVAVALARLERGRDRAREQAHRREAELSLLADLESIRGRGPEHDDAKRVNADYGAAFRNAELNLDKVATDQAGLWLAAHTRPADLAGYLDDWALNRLKIHPERANWRRLVAAARVADADPWRDALRARIGSNDAGTRAELARLADDAAALDSQPVASLVLLARLLKNGVADHERAVRVLRQTATRYPGEFWVHYELAQALRSAGSLARAGAPPRDADEVVRHLTAALAIRPDNGPVRIGLGVTLEAVGKRDEAIAEFREAVRRHPGDVSARVRLGVSLQAEGKRDEAIAEFQAVIRRQPDLVAAHTDLGIFLCADTRATEAMAEYREAIRLDPEFAPAYTHLGAALLHWARFDEAIALHRKAIRLDPNFALAHANLGLVLQAQGKRVESGAENREALRLAPNSEHYRSESYDAGSDGASREAVAKYREAVRLQREFPFGDPGLRAGWHSPKTRDAAIAACREAIRFQPDFALAHAQLASAYEALGKHEDAAAESREALRLEPNDPPLRAARSRPLPTHEPRPEPNAGRGEILIGR
jgi:serine/threonine-protein kinase